MLVKICGIKTLSDAQTATSAGADFLGFNFVPTSRRCISEETAEDIIAGLGDKRPKLVGVFQNQPAEFVNALATKLGFDFIQLHGEESPEYCAEIRTPVIKAFGLDSDFNTEEVFKRLSGYRVAFYMLDRKGRTGELLNSQKVAELAKKFPIILAGGLTPENVRATITSAGTIQTVDVAVGVERDGEKDAEKIKKFVNEARI